MVHEAVKSVSVQYLDVTNYGLKELMQLSKLLISIVIEEEKLARQETEVVCLRAFYHPPYSPIILRDR